MKNFEFGFNLILNGEFSYLNTFIDCVEDQFNKTDWREHNMSPSLLTVIMLSKLTPAKQ